MKHHILIPTDFSENAWSAALYAINLYGNQTCTFYFIHAWTFINTGSRTYVSPKNIDSLIEMAKEKLMEVKHRAETEFKNEKHEFKSIFTTDSLTDALRSAIKEHRIDIVVMGTKGATGAQEFLLGSNAVTVINHVKSCPVLLIPKNYEYETPTQIGFPTGFFKTYGRELMAIKKLVDLHKSDVNILHINGMDKLSETQRTNFNILKEYLRTIPHTFYWKSDYAKKEQAIKDFIEENKINILAMVYYEHSFLEDFIKEPVVKKMGYHSVIPFLVVPYTKQ